ncbi:acyltransferase [Massilia sp. ZL223]|uniref:acyltransferase family protein n=1 Tax=Massilia sp. ZL223 TaxID=2824904 RepID=UPI001B833859|nr:acyltransferase [Massilia sp. ZL223]MBQ5965634.1 acyltransferase [Massilia sp. ZL223]
MHHQRLPGLDLLRAFAIVWVMAYHLVSYGPQFGPVLGPIADLGWMGVDLFFVLSGFLVGGQVCAASAAPEGPRWGDYLLRRALRVLPAYLAVLALYLWLPGWRESPGMQPAWQFLSFTANLFPDYFRNRAFSHAWSLCVEEHFYLLLPLAVALLSRRPSLRKSALFVLAVLLGGIALRAWAWHAQVAPYLHVKEGEDWFVLRYIEHVYNPTWARLDGLLIGAALAAVRLHRPAWWRWMTARGWAFLAAGLLLVIAAAPLFEGLVTEAGAVVGFPLLSLGLGCVLVGMASPAILPGRIELPGARLVATLAFSLYLTHKSMFRLVSEHAGAYLEGSNLLVLGCYGGAALAAGALLYLAVERPGLRLRERLARRHVRPALALMR